MTVTIDQLLKPFEVSALLEVPTTTLTKWRYLGKGPRYEKLGHLVRYRARDIQKWLDARSSK